jgi:hypothetical protein
MAIKAFAPPLDGFKRGRDFAAWLGLVPVRIPVQKSTGGRQILGRTSKMGQRDIRAMSDHDMKMICDHLNNPPRKCLGWKTPAEVFREKILEEMR